MALLTGYNLIQLNTNLFPYKKLIQPKCRGLPLPRSGGSQPLAS